MRGPAALATYVAGALIFGGFAVIYLAWNGAAGSNRLPEQFPYLVSGGMLGVGFVIAGCGLWITQSMRQLSAQRALDMKRLDLAMAGVVGLVRGPVELAPTAAGGEVDDLVVAGRSSYHDPACHLVADRADLERMPRSRAVDLDLSACRVCKPQ